MLTEDNLNALADIFEDRFSEVSSGVLQYIGETLKSIKELTPSQARRLQQMYNYGADINSIKRQLSRTSGMKMKDIESLFESVAREGYEWSKPFYDAGDVKQIPFRSNDALQEIIRSQSAITANTLKNISNTTVFGIKTARGFENFGRYYKKAVDKSISAVITGVTDYNTTIREVLKELGGSGLRIQHASGHTRRLDSAVRQNVLDGVRHVAQETANYNGRKFGADGVELSAHTPCAPDHLPYQGRQYSNAEFNVLQRSLDRPIGEWNCMHIAYSILLGVSRAVHTSADRREMQRYSREKIVIEGREYTRYECTQIQRQIETEMRNLREGRALYKAVGDAQLTREANKNLRLLADKYTMVSDRAGLPMRAERTKTVMARLTGG